MQERFNLYSSPLLSGLVNQQGQLFKIENRQLVCLAGDKQEDYSTLYPIENEGYISISRRAARRIDRQGKTRWELKSGRLWPGSTVDGVLFAHEGRYLLAIDDRSGKVLWHTPSEGVYYPSPAGPLAIRGHRARLLDRQGAEQWAYEATEKIRGAYAWKHGIWLLCRDSIHAVDNAGKRLGVVRGEENYKACLDDGTLIVSDETRDARYNASSSGQSDEEITLTAIAPSGRRLWHWRSKVLTWNVVGRAEQAYVIGEHKLTALSAAP